MDIAQIDEVHVRDLAKAGSIARLWSNHARN